MSEIGKISKKMSWGTELWDQYDNLIAHTNKGVQLLDRFANFVRDRIQIEAEYAAKLRKLSKSYQPKKIENEDYDSTCSEAFSNMLREIGDVACHREVFVESLKQRILQGVSELSNKLQQERKACAHDYTTLQQNLNSQLGSLERAKRHYEKAYLESKKAIENYKKADLDLNLSRAEVYRCNNLMHTKMQESEDAKLEYSKQLQKTNSFQKQHYAELLPAVLNRLQLLDQKRSVGIADFMVSAADVEITLLPAMIKCMKSIKEAAGDVNEEQDSSRVISRLKTGQTPPTDLLFEDLSKIEVEKTLPLKNAKSTNTFMKDITLFRVYKSIKQRRITEACFTLKNLLTTTHEGTGAVNLTSSQRKKLHIKIGELHKKIKKESDAYNDLTKLKHAFDNNTASGNPVRVTEQLIQLNKKIEKLKADLLKYQKILEKPLDVPDSSSSLNEHFEPSETDDGRESVDTDSQAYQSSVEENNSLKVKKWLQNIAEVDAGGSDTSLDHSNTLMFDSGKGSVDEIILNVTETETETETERENELTSRIFCAMYSAEKTSDETLSTNESDIL